MDEKHGRSMYNRGCRCSACREACRVDAREYRARKRGLEPVPSVPTPAPVEAAQPGPCVLAVRADVARWGVQSEETLVAVAEALARILDNPNLATTAPSAAGKLMQLVAELRERATSKQPRLAAVQEMSKPSRPDAG